MGLAAGQARLLTITGRKSDCEFESMRLSHQKIALARDLAALSNEYQNSINQTKLVYDFYGTGDTSMDLTYATFMTPSVLNNYKPILVTDSMNRVVLNAQYAAAAEAAGIPREGLGTLPSETMRNNFIAALANQHIVYEDTMVFDKFKNEYVKKQVAKLEHWDPPKVDPQIISDYMCTQIVGDVENGILGVPYNQDAGYGGTLTGNSVVKKEMTLDEICDLIKSKGEGADVGNACSGDVDHIKRYIINTYQHDSVRYNAWGTHYIGEDVEDDEVNNSWNCYIGANGTGDDVQGYYNKELRTDLITGTLSNANNQLMTIGDIIVDYLQNGTDYMLTIQGKDDHNNLTGRNGIVDYLCNCNLWEQMFDTFEEIFDDGSSGIQMALLGARETIEEMLYNPSEGLGDYDTWDVEAGAASVSVTRNDPDDPIFIEANYRGSGDYSANVKGDDGMNDFDSVAAYSASLGGDWYDDQVVKQLSSMTGYVGMCVVENNDNYGSSDNDSDMSAGCINMSRIIMAYLTQLYINLNGTNAGNYSVQKGYYKDNNFIDGSCKFVVIDTEVSSDVASYAAFYDTIFNKICRDGWCENDNIEDTEYLQQVLKNGMVYITKEKEDRYYYQGNYAIDPYIKEVADETLIAKAEAWYNTEKAKLNAKEETIDLKMKNLDTEISALTTEYDTVKNTISKQIEKSFKRYNA